MKKYLPKTNVTVLGASKFILGQNHFLYLGIDNTLCTMILLNLLYLYKLIF